MNGKMAKRVNRMAEEIILAWLKSVVPEEDVNKITNENFAGFLPEDTHFYAKKCRWVSFYTIRWAKQNIKKLMKQGRDINSITLKDIEWQQK